MKILLDENFPLPLYHRLRRIGHDVEHIIVLGQRGLSDDAIRERLVSEAVLFLTHDEDFADLPPSCRATVVVSSVRQNRPIAERIDIWVRAIAVLLGRRPEAQLFEILDTGDIVPWEIHPR